MGTSGNGNAAGSVQANGSGPQHPEWQAKATQEDFIYVGSAGDNRILGVIFDIPPRLKPPVWLGDLPTPGETPLACHPFKVVIQKKTPRDIWLFTDVACHHFVDGKQADQVTYGDIESVSDDLHAVLADGRTVALPRLPHRVAVERLVGLLNSLDSEEDHGKWIRRTKGAIEAKDRRRTVVAVIGAVLGLAAVVAVTAVTGERAGAEFWLVFVAVLTSVVYGLWKLLLRPAKTEPSDRDRQEGRGTSP